MDVTWPVKPNDRKKVPPGAIGVAAGGCGVLLGQSVRLLR